MTFVVTIMIVLCITTLPTTRSQVYQLEGEPETGYSLSVRLGTPPQQFRVLVDSGSSNFAVAGSHFSSIQKYPYFNTSLSQSFRDIDTNVGVRYVDGEWSGRVGSKYQTNSYLMMYELNKWAVVILFPFILFGEGFAVVQFVLKNPEVIFMILAFSFTSAIGQNFIFLTISNFGPLSLSLITTLRKFFTVLGSILVFGHVLTNYQKLSVVVVFTGILLDTWVKSSKKKTV